MRAVVTHGIQACNSSQGVNVNLVFKQTRVEYRDRCTSRSLEQAPASHTQRARARRQAPLQLATPLVRVG